MRPRVVVVGDLVTDVVARLQEDPVPASDAAASVSFLGGGAAANAAGWLAVTGTQAVLIARIGDDAMGRQRAAELSAAGVDARLAVDPSRPTGAIVVVVAPDGERTMFPDRGANLALAPHDLPAELFAQGAHLHLSGYTLLHPGPRPAGLRALALARAAGMTISVDPASARPLAAVGAERFLEWTAGADLCLPNRDEARILSGARSDAQTAEWLAQRYRQAVVTLGADGALWSDGQRRVHAPAAEGEVSDSTGAGDAFAAGFLAAWLADAEPREALAAGCSLAARACAIAGGRPQPPS